MELDCTSNDIGPRTFESYMIGKIVANQSEVVRLIKLLHPMIWVKDIKDTYLRYKSFRTETHLVFINNEDVHHFFKIM